MNKFSSIDILDLIFIKNYEQNLARKNEDTRPVLYLSPPSAQFETKNLPKTQSISTVIEIDLTKDEEESNCSRVIIINNV